MRLAFAAAMTSLSSKLAGAALFAILLSTAASASAADAPTDGAAEAPQPAVVARPPARRELNLAIGPGAFHDGHGSGVMVDAQLLHRRGWLAVGLAGNYGGTVISRYNALGAAGAVGVSLPTARWLRIDLLATGGAHHYSGVGSNEALGSTVSGDAGADAWLPFVGARLGCSVELGSSPGRLALGLLAIAETDVIRTTKSYAVNQVATLQSEERLVRHRVGTERLGGVLTLGGTFDL